MCYLCYYQRCQMCSMLCTVLTQFVKVVLKHTRVLVYISGYKTQLTNGKMFKNIQKLNNLALTHAVSLEMYCCYLYDTLWQGGRGT